MSVGLCLISHNGIGEALLDTASCMLDGCPLPVVVISVTAASEPDETLRRALAAVRTLDQGDGVIVLTDMFGSTPSNIATALAQGRDRIAVIAGMNLPMLIRLLNYPRLSLPQLVEKALSGGREGIFSCGHEGEA